MNNRILKFRIWDTNLKKFILPFTNFNSDGTLNDLNGEYIIQQFTGLLDKNNKDIYEGDIVSVLDDNNVFEVKFGKVKRNIFGFDTDTIYSVELNTFYFEQEKRPYFSITNNFLGKHDLEDTEIIGNIFQNPELLK